MFSKTLTPCMVGVLALVAGGCGYFAVRPPTPAAKLDRASLDGAVPGEHYYVLVFGSLGMLPRPAYAHSWATVVRAVDQPGRLPALDFQTISWMPATLKIRPLRRRVEPGVNLTLHNTIAYARSVGERISVWGPYECRPSFYRRFLIQKEFMESGRVGYQCVDDNGEAARTGDGCNCLHAISDMDPEYGRAKYPLIWYGDPASEHLVNSFHERGSLLHTEIVHDWLLEPIGLQCAGLVCRHIGDRLINFPRLQPGRLFGKRAADTREPGGACVSRP